jgi:hypothetical protein
VRWGLNCLVDALREGDVRLGVKIYGRTSRSALATNAASAPRLGTLYVGSQRRTHAGRRAGGMKIAIVGLLVPSCLRSYQSSLSHLFGLLAARGRWPAITELTNLILVSHFVSNSRNHRLATPPTQSGICRLHLARQCISNAPAMASSRRACHSGLLGAMTFR